METLALAFEESGHRQAEIILLLLEAFPDMGGAFYGFPRPWMLVLGLEDSRVIAHLAVYRRRVLIDQAPKEIGLIGGVAVADHFRGRGFVRPLVSKAHALLRERDIEFSVLFAFDHRHYRSSGYVPMTNETSFVEGGARKKYVYRGGMVACLTAKPWTGGLLDLQGEVV